MTVEVTTQSTFAVLSSPSLVVLEQSVFTVIMPGTRVNVTTQSAFLALFPTGPTSRPRRRSSIMSVLRSTTFPTYYTFLSTTNTTTGGLRSDWTSEIAGSPAWGDLVSSDRWILAVSSDRSKDYQQKLITPDQYSVVDLGNARVTFSSDLTTFTGDDDFVHTFAEFYDASDVFLGREISQRFAVDDAGPGFTNIITVSNKVVPPGTRKINFGWQGGRRAGTELSAYVRGFEASLTEATDYTDAAVVFAENNPDDTGWTVTTGFYSSFLDGATGAPGAGNRGGYGGASGASHISYKDYALPAGWAAKVAAANGGVDFLYRASSFNTNSDDDTGVRISFVSSSRLTVDTGFISIGDPTYAYEVTGRVPPEATAIRVQYSFRRQDGTVCDSYIGQPSLLLLRETVIPASSPTKLLCHFNEPNTSTLFYDQTGKAMTTVGNAQIRSDQSRFGGTSGRFDGSGDRVTVPDSSDWDIGTAPYTLEAFVRLSTKITEQTFVTHWTGTVAVSQFAFYLESGVLKMRFGYGGSFVDIGAAWTPTLGVWYHVAVDRDAGGVTRVYVDGVAIASASTQSAAPNACPDPLVIGAIGIYAGFPAYDFNGWMDELRFTKGVARYAGNFTPPVAPFANE